MSAKGAKVLFGDALGMLNVGGESGDCGVEPRPSAMYYGAVIENGSVKFWWSKKVLKDGEV